ncbi:hypothetical protein P692DRAFT_20828639 [Suillus brevipes Sb2]|nr:hypothetical protein P692DRAFT_20828639 [Suillus brevipes Sb2]
MFMCCYDCFQVPTIKVRLREGARTKSLHAQATSVGASGANRVKLGTCEAVRSRKSASAAGISYANPIYTPAQPLRLPPPTDHRSWNLEQYSVMYGSCIDILTWLLNLQ